MKKYIYAIILLLIGIITYPTICYARTYQISSANTESEYNFWNGWKEFHYGATDIGSKKGDSVTFRTPMIVNGNLMYYESTGTMRGYGYYSFDFSKHILGLLSYLKRNLSNATKAIMTEYVPHNDIPEFDEYGQVIEPSAINIGDSIDKATTKIVANWYSSEYEQGEFADFWTKCITDIVNRNASYKSELKKLQNKFYFDAYASNAISKLTDLMGNSYCRDLSDKEMTALRGVVFSIMEARYRNKNMQGKTNLKLKVAEGDLWPFLVNLKNLNKITRDSSGHYSPALEFPDFDDVIDGAYQWMYYYDSQINLSTSHSTVTSYMNAQMEEEEETEADWEGEYDALTHEDFPYLNSNAELTAFYTRCSTVRTLFKKSTENAEGIFGAEELYDITSETSYSEAMKKMKDSMDRFANAVGGDIKDVFTGLTDYNIERTYLMAKNIVENEVIQNEYAYYNIGTNIITFTPGLDGSEYLLIDFQKVKLEEPLIKFNGNNRYETNKDTDKDGILDKLELGDGHSSGSDETELYKKVNITGFIKKMVQDELYGTDTESLNSEEGKLLVESALANIKYNVYKKRKEFLEDHGDDNVTDRAEEYEHYLNLDSGSASAISTMTNRAQIIERLKGDNAKLQVELYKYTSNPVLKDTDFDGLDDNDDPTPKNGTLYYYTELINNNGYINLYDTMDYRYFYMSNKYYYDELARISLIMSNAVTKGISGTGNFGATHIDEAMKSIGMKCDYQDVIKDNFKVGYAIGQKEIEYADIKKNVVLIAVSNARTVDEYEKFSDIGESNWSSDNNYNVNHYKAYEKLAQEIYLKLDSYTKRENLSNKNVVYWVTGYGTGGGIANILSAKIADKPPVSTAILDINTIFDANNFKFKETGMTNLYAYTFGAPYTVYTDDIGILANANKYKSIFNVVETNDSFAHLPSTKSSWTRYGWNMSIDNNNHKECTEIVNAYNGIVCTTEGFWRDNLYELQTDDSGHTDKNKAIDVIKLLMKARGEKELMNVNTTYESLKQKSDKRYNILFDKYSKYYDVLEKSHSIKNYYDIAKKVLPENMKTGDGWESKVDIYGNEMKEALDTMGKWYVKNVYTYQVGSYGAVRHRIIDIPIKDAGDICGYIATTNGDSITADNIKDNIAVDNNYKKVIDPIVNQNKIKYYKVTYEQNIPLDKAEKELRKGTIQKDDKHVSYYDGERYQAEFKHRFEYYLNTCGEETRDSREEILNKKRINPKEIYSFDKKEDGTYWYDVDNYINGEIVKRDKGIARGTYKYKYNEKTILNVADDCSGFAEAVLIKFIKDMQMEGSDKLTNLWYGSSSFANGEALNELEKYGFKCYKANTEAENKNGKEDELKKLYDKGLQYGDLVCSNGHVEFYRDDTHSFGWGRTHDDYENNDKYSYDWVWSDKYNCLCDSSLITDDGKYSLGNSDKYVAVYRWEE